MSQKIHNINNKKRRIINIYEEYNKPGSVNVKSRKSLGDTDAVLIKDCKYQIKAKNNMPKLALIKSDTKSSDIRIKVCGVGNYVVNNKKPIDNAGLNRDAVITLKVASPKEPESPSNFPDPSGKPKTNDNKPSNNKKG